MAKVRFTAGARDVSLLHNFEIGSGTDAVSYPLGNGGEFSCDEAVGTSS
jgi:hypothetical protein